MSIRKQLGLAIKMVRTEKNLTQEDFSDISSRTYLSTLERGLKNPTVDKLGEISEVLGVHPLTLLVLSYGAAEGVSSETLLERVKDEVGLLSKIKHQ